MRVAGVSLDAIYDSGSITDVRDARHLLVWGAGQRRLRLARIAVVGVGGTGSHVTVQVSHLGIGQLVLFDPDIVEVSNLSRLIGATASDIGKPKVEVLASVARRIRPELPIDAVRASVLEIDAATLATCDVIVCCTDGRGPEYRSLLTQLAAQYLVPLIDLGIEIQGGGGGTRAGGGVRVVRPDDPFLHCMGILDPALVREDFLSEQQRRLEAQLGYLRGGTEPAPSVVALNGVVASLAVIEVLDLLLGLFAAQPRRVLYRRCRSVTTAQAVSEGGCFVCGSQGIIGLGDARRLPRRPQNRAGSGWAPLLPRWTTRRRPPIWPRRSCPVRPYQVGSCSGPPAAFPEARLSPKARAHVLEKMESVDQDRSGPPRTLPPPTSADRLHEVLGVDARPTRPASSISGQRVRS